MPRNTESPTPYARTETRKGPGNEYDWTTADYEVGMCDTCGLKDEYIGEVGRGWGPLDAWVARHNQTYHEAETRPKVAGAEAIVQVELVCGHRYDTKDDGTPLGKMRAQAGRNLANADGFCGKPLHLYTGGWKHPRPLYVCSMGHYVEVPERLDNAQVAKSRRAINSQLDGVREQFELNRQMEHLERRRRTVRSPRA
jgi:hypothetical protein